VPDLDVLASWFGIGTDSLASRSEDPTNNRVFALYMKIGPTIIQSTPRNARLIQVSMNTGEAPIGRRYAVTVNPTAASNPPGVAVNIISPRRAALPVMPEPISIKPIAMRAAVDMRSQPSVDWRR